MKVSIYPETIDGEVYFLECEVETEYFQSATYLHGVSEVRFGWVDDDGEDVRIPVFAFKFAELFDRIWNKYEDRIQEEAHERNQEPMSITESVFEVGEDTK